VSAVSLADLSNERYPGMPLLENLPFVLLLLLPLMPMAVVLVGMPVPGTVVLLLLTFMLAPVLVPLVRVLLVVTLLVTLSVALLARVMLVVVVVMWHVELIIDVSVLSKSWDHGKHRDADPPTSCAFHCEEALKSGQ